MKEGIIVREKCPICDNPSSKIIFKRSFDEDIIMKYIEIKYDGNADVEYLKNVPYEILKCNKCQFAYQKYVFDNEKSSELYDKWIDPKLALEWNKPMQLAYKNYSYLFTFAKKILKKTSIGY